MEDEEQNFNAESSGSEEAKNKMDATTPAAEEVQFTGIGMGLAGSFAGVGGGTFGVSGGGPGHPVPLGLSQGFNKGLPIRQV